MPELYYGNYLVVPYRADWKTRPKLTLHTRTSTKTAPVGNEKRAYKWATFRRSIEYQIPGLNGDECGRIEETLRLAQINKKAACPYWHDMHWAKTVAGNVVMLDRAPDPLITAGQVIWWMSRDRTSYGLAIVSAAALKTITLVAVPEGFGPDCRVAPLLLGYLSDAPESKSSGGYRQWTVTLAQSMGDLAGSTRDTGTESAALGVSISGKLIDMIDARESEERAVLGIGISGSLVTVVVAGVAAESAAMGVSLSGTLRVVAINTNTSDAATLGVSISGTLS